MQLVQRYANLTNAITYNLSYLLRLNYLNFNLKIGLTSAYKNYNYISLSSGLLIGRCNVKKITKKSTKMRFILIDFLKKLLIILKVRRLIVILKGFTFLLTHYINYLLKPYQYGFNKSSFKELTEEGAPNRALFKLIAFYYRNSLKNKGLKAKKTGTRKKKSTKKNFTYKFPSRLKIYFNRLY
jgi:hypothetical protein